MIVRDTPQRLLAGVAHPHAAAPVLGIQGVHFFTFASLAATAKFAEEHARAGVDA
jgi:hypothetical protein